MPSLESASTEFRQLYESNFELVSRLLMRLGVRPADAVDQAQSVFMLAYVRRDSFEGRSTLRTWLWGICKRVASDYRRVWWRRYELLVDSIDCHVSELTADAPCGRE